MLVKELSLYPSYICALAASISWGLTFGIIQWTEDAWTVSVCTSPALSIIAAVMFAVAMDDRRYRRESHRWLAVRDIYLTAQRMTPEQLQSAEWAVEKAFPGGEMTLPPEDGKPTKTLWTGAVVTRAKIEEVKASVNEDGELPPLRDVDTPETREIYHALKQSGAIKQEPGQAPVEANHHMFEQVLR